MANEIVIPLKIEGGDRAQVAFEEVVGSLSRVQRKILEMGGASEEGQRAILGLTQRFKQGEISADELRASLVHLAGDAPKTADELKRAADAAARLGAASSASARNIEDFYKEIQKAAEESQKLAHLQGPIGSSFSRIGSDFEAVRTRAARFAEGYTEVASGIAGGAAAAVAAGVAFGRLAAQGDLNALAAANVAGGYDSVSRATSGTVTALAAYRAQQTLVNSGLRISGNELAAVARHAREHRDVTQSAEEAVQELTEALRNGEAEGLRKYGIAVQEGATRAQTFENALRQMRETAEGTAPALRTTGESMDAMTGGARDAVTALASLASQGLGLNNVVTNLSTDIRRLGDDLTELAARRANAERDASEERERARLMEDVRQNRANVAQVLREQGMSTDLLPDAGLSLNRLNRQQLTEVAGTIASIRAEVDSLRATNERDVLAGFARERNSATGILSAGRVESVATGLGANDAERAVEAMRRARRGADPNAAADRRQVLETRLRFLTGQIMEALNPSNPRDRAAQPTAAETPTTSTASAANDNARPRRATIEELMGRAFERSGPRAELPGVVGDQTPEQLRASGERIREGIRAQREADQRKGREGYERSDAGVRASVESERVASRERRALDERRDNLRSFTDFMEEQYGRQVNLAREGADAVAMSVRAMGSAYADNLVAWAEGSKTFEEAANAMLATTLSTIAKEAAAKSAFNIAEGIFALATYRYDAAALHFAAAAGYGVLAYGAGYAASAVREAAPTKEGEKDRAKSIGSGAAAPMSSGSTTGGGTTVINVAFNGPQFGTGGVVQAARQLVGVINSGAVQGGVQLNRLAIPARV